MEVYRISSWLFLLLGMLCLATTLQGVQGGAESEGPSESECRPFIEKALKELEISTEPIAPSGGESGETKEEGSDENEEISTVEITTDDSDHMECDGDNDDEAEESRDSTESAEIDVGEAASSKEEVDDDQSEDQKETETSSEHDKVTSQEETQEEEEETQANATDEDVSKEDEETAETEDQDESSETVQSVEDEEGETEEIQSAEDIKDGSDETDNKRESAEVQGSAEIIESVEDTDAAIEDEKESAEDNKSGESDKESTEATEGESREDKSESEGHESNEESADSGETEQIYEEESEQPLADEPAAEDQQSAEDEKSGEEDQESIDDKSAEESDAKQLSAEEGESIEDAESDVVDEGRSAEVEGDDSKEGDESSIEKDTEEGGVSEERGASEDGSPSKESDASKEDDGDGDHGTDSDQDSDSKIQKDDESVEEEVLESENVHEIGSEKEYQEEPVADESATDGSEETGAKAEEEGSDKEALDETAPEEGESQEGEEETESAPEEELINEGEIPDNLRPTDHIPQLLKLDDENSATEKIVNGIAEITLRDLKKLYENAIKPLETLYKYRDLSNRHFGDSEIFSKPLVLFMGPWSGGKSSIINYLVENEYNETSLRTGAEPSPAYFNILMHGQEPEILDGTQLAADFTFSGLQKFGQGLEERLRGLKLPQKLLEKINIVEIPGILEVRKQISRVFPFNDACQWFIDRADIIYLVYDPSKLDVGPETEAILDQLKGREHQTRIILNKADQVKPEELMRVQGALIWNISPLMSSAQPPMMYTTSLWSKPYEIWAPVRLLQAQERAFLRDLRSAIDKRIENKIASARRFAVRVRNHAKMVDCYLTTYYNHKSVFGNRKQVSDAIIEHPQDYHIYEGLSTLTNISRYDLPDPDVYRDFFRLNPLYDFQQLSATCTYFRGCPINRLDVAIAYDLPELVGKHKRMVETALAEANLSQTPGS